MVFYVHNTKNVFKALSLYFIYTSKVIKIFIKKQVRLQIYFKGFAILPVYFYLIKVPCISLSALFAEQQH